MLQRHSTAWHEALDAFVLARRDWPFAWGTHDCCIFAADWVLLARGVDYLAGLRIYADARHAALMLRDEGGLLQATITKMGEPIPALMAQAGDIALVRHGEDHRRSLAVCVGHAFVAPGNDGLVTVPLTDAEAAWRV